jgi:hypothetical protein
VVHVKEAVHLLELHEVTMRRKIARGEIPGVLQLGGPGCAVRILEDELARWLQVPAERRAPDYRQVEAPARIIDNPPGPTVAEALASGKRQIDGGTK